MGCASFVCTSRCEVLVSKDEGNEPSKEVYEEVR